MTRDRENIAQQMRQIESLFSPNNNNNHNNNYNNTKVNVELSRDLKCDVHGSSARRISNGSSTTSLNRRDSLISSSNINNNNNINYKNNNINKQKGFVNDKRIYDDIKRDKNGIGQRRESMPSLNTYSSYYNRVYEPNKNIHNKEMEHPSDFPSILRKSSLTMSQNYLRTPNKNVGLTRSRENFHSIIIDNKKFNDKQLNKRNSFCGDLRHENLGSSLFLRRDSSGNTNLIRRDSIGSSYSRRGSIQNLKDQQQYHYPQQQTSNIIKRNGSISRDYVRTQPNDLINTTITTKPHEIQSILRKTPTAITTTINDDCLDGNDHHLFKNKENHDSITTNNNNNNLLTKENLKKHVTLLESKYDKLGQRRRSSIESIGSTGTLRRHSIDSLEQRRNSLDLRESETSSSYEKILPTIDPNRPKFVAVTSLEDVQAVRCAEFHPNGKVYAVGSNSKTFRICEYPSLSEIREEHTTYQPTVLFKRTRHHKGSIYCMAWSPQGDLVATGSNDKTVKLMRYNDDQKQLEGREIELTMHDGTVRDLCFIEDSSNQSSLLISGGAGDCKIYVTDCATSTPFQALSGHGGHVLSLYNWGGAMFVSGSQDKTVRFWDLRTRGCVNMVTPATVPGSRQGSPVASLCVDPSGRLLVSGHEDSSCVLYDIRGNRPIQCFKPHSSDIRSIRFSPSAYYLLTGGYDNKLVLTDLQGDLTLPLPSVVVAQHTDKIISGRWHPTDFSFISTSADKTATLWALPPI